MTGRFAFFFFGRIWAVMWIMEAHQLLTESAFRLTEAIQEEQLKLEKAEAQIQVLWPGDWGGWLGWVEFFFKTPVKGGGCG